MQAEIERLKIEVANPRDSQIHTTALIDVTLVAGIKDWKATIRDDRCTNFSRR
jgi:hypothetical protein